MRKKIKIRTQELELLLRIFCYLDHPVIIAWLHPCKLQIISTQIHSLISNIIGGLFVCVMVCLFVCFFIFYSVRITNPFSKRKISKRGMASLNEAYFKHCICFSQQAGFHIAEALEMFTFKIPFFIALFSLPVLVIWVYGK